MRLAYEISIIAGQLSPEARKSAARKMRALAFDTLIFNLNEANLDDSIVADLASE